MSIDIIQKNGTVLAIVVRAREITDSLKFISPENFPLQVGIHNREKNVYIGAHEHVPFGQLKGLDSQEIFYIESGKAEVGLFLSGKKFQSVTISKGDLILLNTGHDVKFLEDTKMIEVKQGPYRGKENEKRQIK